MDKLILNAKPLLGFDKDYSTENGDIISMDYRRTGVPKKLAPQRNIYGYAIIKLMKGGKSITYSYNNNYGTRNKRIAKAVTKVWELRKQAV